MEASSVLKRDNSTGKFGKQTKLKQIINVCTDAPKDFCEDSGSEYDEDQFADVDEDVLIAKSNNQSNNNCDFDRFLLSNSLFMSQEESMTNKMLIGNHSLERIEENISQQKPKSQERVWFLRIIYNKF